MPKSSEPRGSKATARAGRSSGDAGRRSHGARPAARRAGGSPPRIRRTWRGDLEQAYEEAVRRWLSKPAGAGALQYYRRWVFPLSCERIRQQAEGRRRLDLLFVPVGTQAYAPILAVVAAPAEAVALLETETSAEYADTVEQALALDESEHPEGPRTRVFRVRIREADAADVARKLKAVFDSLGLPPGSRVGADITGGRKPTTAAIAGVASLFGWSVTYVEGVFERSHGGLAHHERIRDLPNVLDVFGQERRDLVLALARAGALGAAVEKFDGLVAASGASARDRPLGRLLHASRALRDGDVHGFARHGAGAARDVGHPLGKAARDVLRAARGQGQDVRRATALLLLLGAEARLAVGDGPGAWALVERAAMQMGWRGWRPQEGPPPLERAWNRLRLAPDEKTALEQLDSVFGRGLPKHLEPLA